MSNYAATVAYSRATAANLAASKVQRALDQWPPLPVKDVQELMERTQDAALSARTAADDDLPDTIRDAALQASGYAQAAADTLRSYVRACEWMEDAERAGGYIEQAEYAKHYGVLQFAVERWTRDYENNPTEANQRRAIYALNLLAVSVILDTGDEQEYRRLCDRALDLACSGTKE